MFTKIHHAHDAAIGTIRDRMAARTVAIARAEADHAAIAADAAHLAGLHAKRTAATATAYEAGKPGNTAKLDAEIAAAEERTAASAGREATIRDALATMRERQDADAATLADLQRDDTLAAHADAEAQAAAASAAARSRYEATRDALRTTLGEWFAAATLHAELSEKLRGRPLGDSAYLGALLAELRLPLDHRLGGFVDQGAYQDASAIAAPLIHAARAELVAAGIDPNGPTLAAPPIVLNADRPQAVVIAQEQGAGVLRIVTASDANRIGLVHSATH
jgi:hypothetical protein